MSDQHFCEEWILDSSCSYHMTPNRSRFLEYHSIYGRVSYMENEQQCRVNGIGIVEVKFVDGAITALQEVKYVQMLKRNLIYLGILANEEYEFRGKGFELKVIRDSMIFLRRKKENVIYFLKGVIKRLMVAIVDEETQTVELWHKILSYISERS